MIDVALLNASFETEATRRNFARELGVPFEEFVVPEGEMPRGYAFDAAVITGSGASVYEDDEWIAALERWTAEAVERGVAVLGVCFGAQLLATALGGRVVGRDERELGYHAIRHTGDSPLFAGVDEEFVAFTSHGDDVVELPPGARRIAENERSLQAFRKDDAVGVQFHPDYDFEMAERITEKRADEPQRAGNARERLTRENHEAAREATLVFDNFRDSLAESD